MNTYKKSRKIVIFICSFCLLLAFGLSVYAWLIKASNSKNLVLLSDFEVSGAVSFVKGDDAQNEVTIAQALADAVAIDGEQLIRVNLVDKNADNYIGDLRIMAIYRGASPAYLRVRLVEKWVERNQFISSDLTGYNIPGREDNVLFAQGVTPVTVIYDSADWYDNRMNDSCFYYVTPILPASVSSDKDNTVSLFLINGISEGVLAGMSNLREKVELDILVQTEAVQPNRYRELWKMESLPWDD